MRQLFQFAIRQRSVCVFVCELEHMPLRKHGKWKLRRNFGCVAILHNFVRVTQHDLYFKISFLRQAAIHFSPAFATICRQTLAYFFAHPRISLKHAKNRR